MNAGSGIIISTANYGPGEFTTDSSTWPPLHRFSDVTWLQWTRATNGDVRNLKYWMRVSLANPDTLAIVDTVVPGVSLIFRASRGRIKQKLNIM